MESSPLVITKKYGSVMYYWNEEDKMLWKQVSPSRGMFALDEVEDPLDIDNYIKDDMRTNQMCEEDWGILSERKGV